MLEEKLAEFNVEVVYKQVLDDKPEQIAAAIKTAIEEGRGNGAAPAA